MLDHLPRDSGHIRWLPRKYILVCLEECDDLKFLFRIKVDHYLEHLGWLRRVVGHCLDATTNLLVLSTVVHLTFGDSVGLGGICEDYELGIHDLSSGLVLLALRLCAS